MGRTLISDWVIIATSGATVDGRNIEKKWLQDMAQHYSESLYSAKLWPDHDRYYGAWGKVVELKVVDATEEALKGEIHLMAKLCPNDELVYLNRRGKYTHTSIEVEKNFRGKGYFYLGGLGITDEPASAGTSELQFKESNSLRLPSVAVQFPEDNDNNRERSLFERFKNFLNKDKGESQDIPMDKEQFEKFSNSQNKTNELLETLIGKFATLVTGKAGNNAEEQPTSDNPANQGEFVSKANYDELAEKFTALDKKFTELINTGVPGTQTEENTGETDSCI